MSEELVGIRIDIPLPEEPRRPEGSEGYDVAELRRTEFPFTERGDVTYLNNASTGPLPERTVAAVDAFTRRRAEPWRITDPEIFAVMARGRSLAAGLVGASGDEIALMPNTTYGINLAARALPLRDGDVVLSFDREFPANVYPWMALGARGVRLEQLPCVDGLPDEAALLRAVERPEVRAVAVSWVQFSTGYCVDLERLGALCRAHGKYLVVDAIQGVGARELDVRRCNVDILSCGAQKWLLSPWGSGFSYVRRELITALEPSSVGWMAVRGSEDFSRLVDYDYTLRDDARRFEVLTLDYAAIVGMIASLELLHELGVAAVAAHVRRLVERVVAWAAGRRDVRLVTPADAGRRAGIVAVAPPDPAAASARLKAAGVIHSLREGAVRLAPHCYNTDDEIDRALALLAG